MSPGDVEELKGRCRTRQGEWPNSKRHVIPTERANLHARAHYHWTKTRGLKNHRGLMLFRWPCNIVFFCLFEVEPKVGAFTQF